MSGHAKLSPSSAHRWTRCPGSVAMTEKYPSTGGFAADEGTFAHLVASKCLEEKADARKYLGSVSAGGVHKCTDEMVEAVQHYLDAVRATMMLAGPRAVLMVEQKVALAGVLAPMVHGTADALVFDVEGGVLHVFDFKYGAGVFVDVVQDEQMQSYGAGALVTFAGQFPRFDDVVLHIVQPRNKQGAPWRTWSQPTPRLVKWADEVLLPAAKLADTDNGKTLVPTVKGCQWCGAKSHCPALKAHALEVAREVFDFVGDEARPKAPDVTALDLADVGRMLDLFPLVESYVKAVRERAFELAKAGVVVPGYKLVETVGNRKWIDETAAERMLRGEGVEPTEPGKLLSPSKAEKALGKKRAGLVAPLVTKPTTGVTLAPEDDKRPAIPSSSDVFAKLTD